jgi:hypothetical protein
MPGPEGLVVVATGATNPELVVTLEARARLKGAPGDDV